MEILQRVARDAAAAALLPPKPVKLKPVKLKPVKLKPVKEKRAKKLVDVAQGEIA